MNYFKYIHNKLKNLIDSNFLFPIFLNVNLAKVKIIFVLPLRVWRSDRRLGGLDNVESGNYKHKFQIERMIFKLLYPVE